jgi:glycerophosphoryl diester phosphodiesterase
VYRDGPTFTLLVDIKSEAKSTYAALRTTLQRFSDILTVVKDDRVEGNAVVVIISGNRPQEMIAADRIRLAGIDGRLSDLNTAKSSSLMPLISDRWASHFSWRGDGPMPSVERQLLRDMVRQAHEAGRRVRFWATPEKSAVWRELIQAEVDLISTDDLAGLQRFLLHGRQP